VHFVEICVELLTFHGNEIFKRPVVFAGKTNTLRMGERPEYRRVDGCSEICMKFCTRFFCVILYNIYATVAYLATLRM
jgi:hypothetical protein